MAKQLNNVPVKMGTVIPVDNQDQKPTASSVYYALKVEDVTGKNEEWLLFTERELYEVLPEMTMWEGFQSGKKGRLFPCYRQDRMPQYITMIERPARNDVNVYVTVAVKISERQIRVARHRALTNPEDIPEQSWIGDMLD